MSGPMFDKPIRCVSSYDRQDDAVHPETPPVLAHTPSGVVPKRHPAAPDAKARVRNPALLSSGVKKMEETGSDDLAGR